MDKNNNNQISASIIADSVNLFGDRITTFVLEFPRIILAEFNTHREFSRNSASSRAIPHSKMLDKIQNHPFIPIKWMKDHSGMQGGEYITDMSDLISLPTDWLHARDKAMEMSIELASHGLTKQMTNRLLEPFLYHKVIVTATNFENFFALRAHEAAEIHIQDLAYKMLDVYNYNYRNNLIKVLQPGQWHIPFGDNIDESRIDSIFKSEMDIRKDGFWGQEEIEQIKIRIASARCARVSYDNFDGTDDYEKDIDLYHRLVSMGHLSPLEHCAMAMAEHNFDNLGSCSTGEILSKPLGGRSGNFKGFIQLRKLFPGENRKDPRVLNDMDKYLQSNT
jgi:thymidylate synthase ThyX